MRLPTGDEDKGLGIGATDYGLSTEIGIDKDRPGRPSHRRSEDASR